MNSFRKIIDAFGVADFAKLIGVSNSHARVMKTRNVIPPHYWRKILEAPRPAGLDSLILADLDDLYAAAQNCDAAAGPSRHQRGGIYYEGFVIGALIEHRLTKTVTQMDNMLFSNMTLNPQPLHIDAHFCAAETEWGRPLINSLFTLGLMVGISVNDLTLGTTIANLGMTQVKFPAPLFEGDTLHVTTEVLSKRLSKSRPAAGIVEFLHRAYQQEGRLVAACRRQAFIKRRSV